jgi:hypothetical protein
VQLLGDIARFYACPVGVIVADSVDPAAVLNQYNVRLADGTTGTLFDFQLQKPPAAIAHLIFDSAVAPKSTGTRGSTALRQLRLLARDVEIHLEISGSEDKTLIGEVTAGPAAIRYGLVTLLAGDETVDSTSSGHSGEFTLHHVPTGKFALEIFIPSRRVIATLNL